MNVCMPSRLNERSLGVKTTRGRYSWAPAVHSGIGVRREFRGRADSILNVRDDFREARWNRLDSFFPGRETCFVNASIGRGQVEPDYAEVNVDRRQFSGRLALLDEDVRSRKEALASQFQKTKSAALI